jgi:small GTP-binding protein
MKDIKIKISIIGDSGCGKTTLMERFCLDEFYEEAISTIGVDYMQKIIKIEDQMVNFDIYDTAGQERYRSIIKSYYRNAHGIILVFDTTSKISFNSLEFWIEEIKNNITNELTDIILVGTKSDLSQKREVYDQDIVDFCSMNKLKYIETSSKMGFNIENLFKTLGINIIRKMGNPILFKYYNKTNNNNINNINNNDKYCCY